MWCAVSGKSLPIPPKGRHIHPLHQPPSFLYPLPMTSPPSTGRELDLQAGLSLLHSLATE
jgi:hypothetical protein